LCVTAYILNYEAYKNTGCGKLATFFIWQLPYEKGSELAAPCIFITKIFQDMVISIRKGPCVLHIIIRPIKRNATNRIIAFVLLFFVLNSHF
jgi:hypothetical protein